VMVKIPCYRCGQTIVKIGTNGKYCDECRLIVKREKARLRYANNVERYRGYAIKHYHANKEACQQKTKKWQSDNPEKVKDHKRKEHWKNRERYLEYNERNKYHISMRRKKWVEKNRLHVNTKNRNRHALKMNAHGTHTLKELIEVCDMCNWQCVYCHKKLNKKTVTADHVVPLIVGGANSIDNILPSCSHCNISKNAKSFLEYLFFSETRKNA